MKAMYEAVVVSQGGRDGHIQSSDGLLKAKVNMPKELGGKGGATNPEQLFAAGYAACFEGALLHVSQSQKVKLTDTRVTATVGIGQRAGGGFELAVALEVSAKGVERSQLEKLVEQTHQTCPYSHATRNNVPVELKIV